MLAFYLTKLYASCIGMLIANCPCYCCYCHHCWNCFHSAETAVCCPTVQPVYLYAKSNVVPSDNNWTFHYSSKAGFAGKRYCVHKKCLFCSFFRTPTPATTSAAMTPTRFHATQTTGSTGKAHPPSKKLVYTTWSLYWFSIHIRHSGRPHQPSYCPAQHDGQHDACYYMRTLGGCTANGRAGRTALVASPSSALAAASLCLIASYLNPIADSLLVIHCHSNTCPREWKEKKEHVLCPHLLRPPIPALCLHLPQLYPCVCMCVYALVCVCGSDEGVFGFASIAVTDCRAQTRRLISWML